MTSEVMGIVTRNAPISISHIIPPLARQGYQWQRPENKDAFEEGMTALLVLSQHGVSTQYEHYRLMLSDLVAKDQADRVYDIMLEEFDYNGRWFHLPNPPGATAVHPGTRQALMNQYVEILEMKSTSSTVFWDVWLYMPLGQFDRMVPPSAVQSIARLDKHNIKPEYWVADKQQIVQQAPPRPLLSDPLLCVKYDRWFVSIAEWL